ncbi:hypothetical protein BDN72DRAFT_956320 [Pluteus cervinus]|uniref:Uncharacterized protein n=1 Tax=Pluteus cervinus TaxID=181527 RepID=A0ACD3B6K8_9AGAR|nr:hypothetical protein BDN72DRAFT_956320 [Pluteus cervinus]
MSSPRDMNEVIDKLGSDKVKDRTEALNGIRTAFASDNVVAQFYLVRSGEGRDRTTHADPKVWTRVFKALCRTVQIELEAYGKGSSGKSKSTSSSTSAAVISRLEGASGTLRWLIEKTVAYMNYALVKFLIKHLLGCMVDTKHRGQLLKPVALNCLKALKALLSFQPHSDHLSDDLWAEIVEKGFNCILGYSLNASLTLDIEDQELSEEDTEMAVDEEEEAVGSVSSPTSPVGKKRRRRDSDGATPKPSQSRTAKADSKPKVRRRGLIQVQAEQVEFASILALLLQSSSAPLLAGDSEGIPYSSAILARLAKFLELYPGDTSMHDDYLSALSSTLSNLSLNRQQDVRKFARTAWGGLVNLWGTRNKRMKENLTVVLRMLFPFVTSEVDRTLASTSFDYAQAIGRLYDLLNGEAENRWGVEPLTLEAIRLEAVPLPWSASSSTQDKRQEVFVASTFRAGRTFNANNALTWALLELQADCAAELYKYSESVQSTITDATDTKGKRRRTRENPIEALLRSITGATLPQVKVYHLQILLFFIDRHWAILHDGLQHEIVRSLLQALTVDDGPIQSWMLLCLAAIAYVEVLTAPPSNKPPLPDSQRSLLLLDLPQNETFDWDSLWTHSIRRVNLPTVCRAASHAAHILIMNWDSRAETCSRSPLSTQKVLSEIETLAKDLDVQGPTYPYDSVCALLSQCLRVANQDVRLFRMRLEDKVLNWLIASWRVLDISADKAMLLTLQDALTLLENICGFSFRNTLESKLSLPECYLVDAMKEERSTAVIRDFVLNAKLPSFNARPPTTDSLSQPLGKGAPNDSMLAEALIQTEKRSDLLPPRARESRLSKFLLNSLEALITASEQYRDGDTLPNAETAHRYLDIAVIALCFDSLVMSNGYQSTKRVFQCACKVIVRVTGWLLNSKWTLEEKGFVLEGLEPLVAISEDRRDESWEAMVSPETGSGIRLQTLRKLIGTSKQAGESDLLEKRRSQLRTLWQHPEAANNFAEVGKTFRKLLHKLLGVVESDPNESRGDERDGFGEIRTSTQDAHKQPQDSATFRSILQLCTGFLTAGPFLQFSGEPSRDPDLVNVIVECSDSRQEQFLIFGPIFLHQVRQRILGLSPDQLSDVIQCFESILGSYTYGRNETFFLLLVHFLEATMSMWLSDNCEEDIGVRIQAIFSHLLSTIRKKRNTLSWKVKNRVAQFFTHLLVNFPEMDQKFVAESQEDDLDFSPRIAVLSMGGDDDIRVRFRVAVTNAGLLAVSDKFGMDSGDMYGEVKRYHVLELENCEFIVTHILSLGNMMVVSSAVHRGAYWHLLEICCHTKAYIPHIKATFDAVSKRLGLDSLASLSKLYVAQLAYSIQALRQASPDMDFDLLQFPPDLLGFNIIDYAKELFHHVTPINALFLDLKRVGDHAKIIRKTLQEGVDECFGAIVGYYTPFLYEKAPDASKADIEERLMAITKSESTNDLRSRISKNVDGIVVAILKTIGDQNTPDVSPVVTALEASGSSPRSIEIYQALTRYRKQENMRPHHPNLPAFGTELVLKALSWFRQYIPSSDTKPVSYHVLHELFASVQRSPLVNEQMRMVNGIAIWIALHYRDFDDATLLHTLVHGAASLLGQLDLVRSAQSILEWAFSCYAGSKRDQDSGLADVLIHICCLAHDYRTNGQDYELGLELEQWIDEKTYQLSKTGEIRPQITSALLAWAHPPSRKLARLMENRASEDSSTVLADHRVGLNKFRLVKRVRDNASAKDYPTSQWAKLDFWRLKEYIPPMDQLQAEDADAFAGLLILNRGFIDSYGQDQPTAASRARLRRGTKKSIKRFKEPWADPRESTVLSLLAILEEGDLTRAHTAYQTLRLIMSVPSQKIAIPPEWPTAYRNELSYLERFSRTSRRPVKKSIKELSSEAYLTASSDFPAWIAMTTTLFSDCLSAQDPFWAQLRPILESDTALAEEMLPYLVQTLLQTPNNPPSSDPTPAACLSKYFSAILSSKETSVFCLRSIVDVVLHMRNCIPATADRLAYDKWLKIDFTLLAKSAIQCGAYTTALLFLELAKEYSPPERLDQVAIENALYEIYTHIDEPDGFYGIQTQDLHRFLIKRFHHEKQWEKAFQFHGAALEVRQNQSKEAEGLLQAFHSFGFDRLAMESLQTSSTSIASSNLSYTLGWRTDTWDLPESNINSPGASVYVALRAVHREVDPRRIDQAVQISLLQSISRLRSIGPENLAEIREVAQDIMCLYQAMQFREERLQKSISSRDPGFSVWQEFTTIDPTFEFTALEGIMATRISLIRSVQQQEERHFIGTLRTPFFDTLIEVEKECLLRLSSAAREANHVQIALNSVIRAQMLEKDPSFPVAEEFANVLWLQKEEKLAVQYLQALANDESSVPPERRATLLARLGSWTSEACLEQPTAISTKFFQPAVAALVENKSLETNLARATVYHQFAVFAERQYHAILKSPEMLRSRLYIERKQFEINVLRSHSGAPGVDTEMNKAVKLLNSDREMFVKQNQARDSFLRTALEMYSRCLEASDDFDDDGPIRLCSLWFANFEDKCIHQRNSSSNLSTSLERVPSRKFLFLAHQLSARLSAITNGPSADSQRCLQALILRMCKEHPFHSLYQVFSIQADQPNVGNIGPSSVSQRRQSSRHLGASSQTDRVNAAFNVFNQLQSDPNYQTRVLNVQKLCEACLDWAKFRIKEKPEFTKKPMYHIPEGRKIRDIKDLAVPVITAHTPVDNTLKYTDCVWIVRYESTFRTAGGVNLPKISVCRGTDGREYTQLFKGEGNDDMRQDAVMEQVFELVNRILRKDRETSRRELQVRGYSVVPLGSQAGLLEFVGNTTPLNSWLTKAHEVYRPQDLRLDKLRHTFKTNQQEYKSDRETCAQKYLELKKKFRPVMRHYFTEKHKNPIAWFAMRLSYTRSVATTSIVGHILGLGDRHISNILLDGVTGEVVHIDLGIAFDQGKLLPVPELVPFRMTDDIVDGMGTSGTQGVFQRCAEETLRVMRQGSEVIMTVLEVFKHDPLHSWTASELKIKRVQSPATGSLDNVTNEVAKFGMGGIGIDMSSGSAEEAADRALSGVARKLDKALSVEYTVNQLIAEARDPGNLSVIFYGWSPWC